MGWIHGHMYRTLINGQEVRYERRVSFEPDSISVFLLERSDEKQYDKWLARKGENVRFTITNTNIDARVILTNIILHSAYDSVVEIELKFQ